MLRNHDLLMSPEGEESGAGGTPAAEPGQQQQGQPAQLTESDQRKLAEANAAFLARDEQRARADKAEAQLAEIEAAKKTPPSEQVNVPEWAKVIQQQVAALGEQTKTLSDGLTKKGAAEQRNRIVDAVLANAPEASREPLRLMIHGLEAQGKISFAADPTAAEENLATLLQQNAGALLRPVGSTKTALQSDLNGAFPWDLVKRASDVPAGEWKNAPPEVMARISSGGGGKAGLSILGNK